MTWKNQLESVKKPIDASSMPLSSTALQVCTRNFVIIPASLEEAFSQEYLAAGLPGCVGSMDATHVLFERIPYELHEAHKGFKMASCARTYNIVVNHLRRILSTTKGHPSRWNDKTLVMYDEFASGLKYGELLEDAEFTLFERDSNGNIVERRYKGAWLIVDNGYLAWSCTVPPMKSTDYQDEIYFSQWLESVRKDVECTFGILKGRWRILKGRIRLHGTAAADKVWATCCALHNMLLEVDGGDDEWTGKLGQLNEEDIPSFALDRHRKENPKARTYDSSGLGRGDDHEVGSDEPETEDLPTNCEDESGVRSVKKMSLYAFRAKLVEHFSIQRSRNQVFWPHRK